MKHMHRGRHEACNELLLGSFWGYTCDRPYGHTGIHYANELRFDAPRGPIIYPSFDATSATIVKRDGLDQLC